jgi:hypothetical protein
MIMEILIEKIFAFVFLLIGLSHLLQPAPWVDFFCWLRSKSFGAFIVVIYTWPVAIVIVTFHNSWELRPAVFITLAGWSMLVKCAIYALHPATFNRVAAKGFSVRNSVIAGSVFIGASSALLVDIVLL